MIDPNRDTCMPTVRNGFLWEPIPEGCLLFEEATGKLITLNPAAEAVLTYCDGEHALSDICRILENDLHISAEDTRAAVKELFEAGVIAPPPTAA